MNAKAKGERTTISPTIRIYTDGACVPNPGSGGWAAILTCDGHRKQISGGFHHTTSNRMELYAAIAGLEAITQSNADVTVFSDSKYIVDAFEKGWALRWRDNGWMRTKTKAAKNADLFARLLHLSQRHRVRFEWVKGHADCMENNICDLLANLACYQEDALIDDGYERPITVTPKQRTIFDVL